MCVCSFPAVIASIFCHSLVCTLPVLSKHDKYFTQLKRYHSTDKRTGKHQIDNNKFHRKEWHSNDASSITEPPLDYFGWNDFIAVLKQTVTNVSLFFLLRKHSFFFMGLSSFSVKWIDYCQIYLFRVFFNFLSRINRSIKGIKDLSSRYIICAMNCGTQGAENCASMKIRNAQTMKMLHLRLWTHYSSFHFLGNFAKKLLITTMLCRIYLFIYLFHYTFHTFD